MPRPELWLDQGGTFTDCILVAADGTPRVVKVPSRDDAPLVGIRALLELGPNDPIPPCDVRLGTTKTTNALLERRGARCGLLITRGFGDLVSIGTQARPDIFELEVEDAQPLYSAVVEVDARVGADASELQEPDWREVREGLLRLRQDGIKSLAVAFVFAHKNPRLELAAGALATELGFTHVALSHALVAEQGFLRRADTTVLDAYLTPLLREYFAALERALPGSSLRIMQSSGELARPENLRGPASILSGPAGGVVAQAAVARAAGVQSTIGFDMGGTSTDVSRFAGTLPRIYESEVASVRVVAPTLEVHTVAAGGGSLCRFNGAKLLVGPESAGSVPGPLCYGAPEATELTVTDINLALGRLQPERFPLPLSPARVHAALAKLAQTMAAAGYSLDAEGVATGFLRIANANMARAVERISVDRGFDVRRDSLVVYGGAGGQHACAVARLLDMTDVIFHPLAGVLSAFGMGLAEEGDHAERDLDRAPLGRQTLARCRDLVPELQAAIGERLLPGAANTPDGVSGITWTWSLDAAYAGTETTLSLPWSRRGDDEATAHLLRSAFEAAHRERFGYDRPGHPIELWHLRGTGRLARPPAPEPSLAAVQSAGEAPRPLRYARIWFEGGYQDDVPVFERASLPPGFQLDGPAYILEDTGAIVVEPQTSLRIEAGGLLRLTLHARERAAAPPDLASPDQQAADPVMLELIGNAFMHVAEEMGSVLQATALSTNIRERLDFSCAVFDRGAQLLANAPHIPVHLGAMAESVRAIAEAHPNPRPGDAYVTNDPAAGGSHLPDITVVTPVFLADELLFYVASRGHHADVGGITPGSMPADSKTLAEEGIVFRDDLLVRSGHFDRTFVLARLTGGAFPARTPHQNIADLEAQLAANQHGHKALGVLLARWGKPSLLAYAEHLQVEASRQVLELLAKLSPARRHFADQLDDGTRIGVQVDISPTALRVEFDYTPEHAGNSNAPRAIVQAALLYVLRALIGNQLPLNSGALRPVQLTIPAPSLLDPGPQRAVVSGNVETSQRIVDVLLGALDAAAASQGTMNNLTFGDGSQAYYETLGGGMGATANAPGASAVQCHMTNTRITDVEVLESRYPVRVLEFSIRRDSGGTGKRRGGNGLVRELEFLAPLEVTLVSERRTTRPFGLHGGGPGKPGVNTLNGEPKPGRCHFRVASGDRLRIETPGGGGWGAPDN